MEFASQNARAIKLEPSLRMVLRPGCCGVSLNGAATCPSCGTPARPTTFHDADRVAVMTHGLGGLLYRFGEWLYRLADKIKGK